MDEAGEIKYKKEKLKSFGRYKRSLKKTDTSLTTLLNCNTP